MRNRTGAVWSVVVLAWVTTVSAGETLETVEKKLTEKSKSITSLTADITMVTDVNFEGGSSKSESKGTLEYLKQGEKFLSRMELKTVATQRFGEQETKMDSSTLTIVDGDITYLLLDQMGQKMAMKQKAQNAYGADADSMLKPLRKEHDLKLLPDSSVDGTATYVIEATPKSAATGGGKIVMYLAKDTGIVLRMLNFDNQGRPMANTTYANIKMNPKIDASRFVFKAPEGVQIMDMTAQ